MDKHRNILAWQKCRELVVATYRATEQFPAHERYGLVSQLRRAAVSAMSNIAEGYARYGGGELAHSLSITLGSLAEVSSLLQVAADLGYITPQQHDDLEAIRKQASKLAYNFQRSVRG